MIFFNADISYNFDNLLKSRHFHFHSFMQNVHEKKRIRRTKTHLMWFSVQGEGVGDSVWQIITALLLEQYSD